MVPEGLTWPNAEPARQGIDIEDSGQEDDIQGDDCYCEEACCDEEAGGQGCTGQEDPCDQGGYNQGGCSQEHCHQGCSHYHQGSGKEDDEQDWYCKEGGGSCKVDDEALDGGEEGAVASRLLGWLNRC